MHHSEAMTHDELEEMLGVVGGPEEALSMALGLFGKDVEDLEQSPMAAVFKRSVEQRERIEITIAVPGASVVLVIGG